MTRETRFDVQWRPVGEHLICLKPLTAKARQAIGDAKNLVTGVSLAELYCRTLKVQCLPEEEEVQGFGIRATLRRVLPEGSTIWTVTQHVTRSGRVTVLPMAFLADFEDPEAPNGSHLTGAEGAYRPIPRRVASRRYVLGREFCEKLGYRWDAEHRGWIGNYGEDASGSIVAALSMAAYDRPDAYSLGRTA